MQSLGKTLLSFWLTVALVGLGVFWGGCALGPPVQPGETHPLSPGRNAFLDALEMAGLTPDALAFEPIVLRPRNKGDWLLPLFVTYMRSPLAIPWRLGHVWQGLCDEQDSPHEALLSATVRTGARVLRGAIEEMDPLADLVMEAERHPRPLLQAIVMLRQQVGAVRVDGALIAEAEGVPRDVARAAAITLHAAGRAALWHERAFAKVHDDLSSASLSRLAEGAVHRWQDITRIEELAEGVDFPYLFAGAQELVLGIEKTVERLKDRTTTETFLFDASTPLGRVVIVAGEEGPSTSTEPVLLWMDLDGDDRHGAPVASRGLEHPVSVLIDCAGDDEYAGGDASLGCGLAGYGVLIDLVGDDSYLSGELGQGCGLFGAGLLMDYAGNDRYDAVALAQGAGYFGVGLLIDLTGQDTREADTLSQGLGMTLGCGMLLDFGEDDDQYLLRNLPAEWPSAQSPEAHSSSCGQGFGLGQRRDLHDGHSWPGGYGLLLDEGGDDVYRAEVMAQGSGFWYGIGALIDAGGNDTYTAHWYAQGAAAHFACGALMDYGGDDTYASVNVSQGGAHDFSVAWLLDAAGADRYTGRVLCLGAGNMNGLGFFADVAGGDAYVALGHGPDETAEAREQRRSLGHSRIARWGSPRECMTNTGLFADCGGQDRYLGLPGGDDSRWRSPRQYPALGLRSERGAGVDGEYPDGPVRWLPYTEPPED